MRSLLLPIAFAAVACSKASEPPTPKVVADAPRTSLDAGVVAHPALDASAPVAASNSPLSIVARGPMPTSFAFSVNADGLGTALPRIQRVAGGGFVVGSEYARVRAEASGPLTVELLGAGLETHVLKTHGYTSNSESLRWVWAAPELTVVVDESDPSRVGPSLTSYKMNGAAFEKLGTATGYWSAVMRGDSVLALERRTLKRNGDGMTGPMSVLDRARIRVLAGKAAAPTLPAGFCPTSMTSASDGTLVVVGNVCTGAAGPGVVRIAPGANEGKVESLPAVAETMVWEHAVPLAVSKDEIYVAQKERLERWDGKQWSHSLPFPKQSIVSLSRAPSGELWAVVHDPDTKKGRLVHREGETWKDVALPPPPTDRLDDETYSDLMIDFAYVKGGEAMSGVLQRDLSKSGPLLPWRVDATGEEILVLAGEADEAFVLSTNARGPVAKIPSVALQRVRLARSIKRKVVSSPKACDEPARTFLTLREGTKADDVRAALAKAESIDASVGESMVEGKTRLVVWGIDTSLDQAHKRLGAMGPQRVCGAPVIEKTN